jgi:regulator of sirC expression with transglutaminase-like and TPR domain
MDNPDVDVPAYMARVDEMAQELKAAFPENPTEKQRLAVLDKYLFEDLGVRGSQYEYYARSNSYLNEVIDDREGLPITLSVLYIELAKRLDLNVVGVGLPGHFVVRFEPAEESLEDEVIDPFERGRRLSEKDILQHLAEAGFPNQPRFREAKSPLQIMERMTMNLLGLVEDERNDADVLRYLETLVMLAPDNPEYRAKRLEMRARTGRLEMAIRDADWFIRNVNAGVDVERVRELRQSLETQLERQQALDAVDK